MNHQETPNLLQVSALEGNAKFNNEEITQTTLLGFQTGLLSTNGGYVDLEFNAQEATDKLRLKNGALIISYGNSNSAVAGIQTLNEANDGANDEPNYSERLIKLQHGQLLVTLAKPNLPNKISYFFASPQIAFLTSTPGSAFILEVNQDHHLVYVCKGEVSFGLQRGQSETQAVTQNLIKGQGVQIASGAISPLSNPADIASASQKDFQSLGVQCPKTIG